MHFVDTPFDPHTVSVMSAALETACMAVSLTGPPPGPQDRLRMEAAILEAANGGLREFTILQRAALDAVGATATSVVDRRKNFRVVDRERRHG